MQRSLRIEIVEREYVFIFVNYLTWDLLFPNQTKDAAIH
jgi:hypothetical protein